MIRKNRLKGYYQHSSQVAISIEHCLFVFVKKKGSSSEGYYANFVMNLISLKKFWQKNKNNKTIQITATIVLLLLLVLVELLFVLYVLFRFVKFIQFLFYFQLHDCVKEKCIFRLLLSITKYCGFWKIISEQQVFFQFFSGKYLFFLQNFYPFSFFILIVLDQYFKPYVLFGFCLGTNHLIWIIVVVQKIGSEQFIVFRAIIGSFLEIKSCSELTT